MQFNGSLN